MALATLSIALVLSFLVSCASPANPTTTPSPTATSASPTPTLTPTLTPTNGEVTVSDTEANTTLQSFSQALAEGDLPAAVTWLPAEAQAGFTEALAELPTSDQENLGAALAQAQRISVEGDPVQQFAYTLVMEGKKVSLLLTMERDEKGVWRVTGF